MTQKMRTLIKKKDLISGIIISVNWMTQCHLHEISIRIFWMVVNECKMFQTVTLDKRNKSVNF